jgi:PAS domain S-box-containing protein
MSATHVSENGSRLDGGSTDGQRDDALPALAVLAWLRRQDETDGMKQAVPESEARRYLELFDLAPGSYVETDVEGVIRLANLASGDMLSVRQDRLVGAELVGFVAADNRREFRHFLGRLQRGEDASGWFTRVEPSTGPPLDVYVAVGRGWCGGARVLRWLLHDITEQRQRERKRPGMPLTVSAGAP